MKKIGVFIQIYQDAPLMKNSKEFEINTRWKWHPRSMSLFNIKITHNRCWFEKNCKDCSIFRLKIKSIRSTYFLLKCKEKNRETKATERDKVLKRSNTYTFLCRPHLYHTSISALATTLCNRCSHVDIPKKRKFTNVKEKRGMPLRQNCFRWFFVLHKITVVNV